MADGSRVSKADPIINSIGEIDELNSLIGYLDSLPDSEDYRYVLRRIQNCLFDIGGSLSVGSQDSIAKEEIFGPVLVIIPFENESDAVAIANDTPYGLAAYLQTGDQDRKERVSAKLKAGAVHINGGGIEYGTPFGGYKQSGNGREGGLMGLEDYLETKTLHGL